MSGTSWAPEEWARVHDLGASEDFVFRRAVEIARQWCEAEIAEGGTLLDAGCGTGHLAATIRSRRCRVIGIDRSFEMVHYARRRWTDHRASFLSGNAVELPLRTASVHGVAAISLMGCIDGLAGFAAECARVLARGGFLCLTATNRHSLPLAFISAQRRLKKGRRHSFSLYVPPQIDSALRAVGLTPIRQRFFGRLGVPPRMTPSLEKDVEPGTRSFLASNFIVLAQKA